MSQEIEIEFKNLLTDREFERLRQHFKLDSTQFTLQHNHYFDTEHFMLKDQNSALRVREKNDSLTLTLKQPHPDGLLETHQKITSEELEGIMKFHRFPNGEVTKALRQLNIATDKLVHFGTLSTNRAELETESGLLVLDHSYYLGTEDYELEYECSDKELGEKAFLKLLHEFHIPKRKTDNKIKRLFNQI